MKKIKFGRKCLCLKSEEKKIISHSSYMRRGSMFGSENVCENNYKVTRSGTIVFVGMNCLRDELG